MSKQNILVVEDEVLIGLGLELNLKSAGYRVCSRVCTGKDAITAASKYIPDCILMDINLRGNLDGIETAKIILSQSKVPIIFITGYPDEKIKNEAKKLNPLGFITKPLEISNIKALIDSILNKQ